MAERSVGFAGGESALDHFLVESLTDYAIFVVSPDGIVLRWNLGAQALFGYRGDEIVGSRFDLLFSSQDIAAGAPENELADALTGPAAGYDRWHVRKDGSRFWGTNTAQPLYDGRGGLLGFTKIVRDLTERQRAADALRESADELRILVEKTQHASLHDDLTGLANKPLFREYLARAIARSERHPTSTFAVLFLDLDHFKMANDRHGHILADRLLVLVSHRLRQAVRTEDVLARFGGDEFAILVEDIESPGDAISIADHIVTSFQPAFEVEGTEIAVRASIGIALASAVAPRTLTADELLEDADFAMYDAKSQGRARYSMFRDAMRTHAKADLELSNGLLAAIEPDRWSMSYQPIVDLRTGRISGFEASAWWQHPQHGELLLSVLRATADDEERFLAIDRWIVSKAVDQMKTWRREFGSVRPFVMHANVSSMELARPAFAAELREVFANANVPPHACSLEIAGTLPMENPGRIFGILTELRTIGLGLHLDVFGGGTVSFVHLSRLPATAFRLNASFVANLSREGNDVEIARTMIAFAHALGASCVAFGVSTQEQCAILGELGCDEALGPFISEPLDADAATAYLAPYLK